MKRIRVIPALFIILFALSCKDSFLEQIPQGQLTPDQVASTKGVENLLISAYGLMNGNINGTWGNYSAAPSQWLFGEVAADNAHKGTTSTDQSFMNDIEHHEPSSINDNLSTMWNNYYEGILRCNNTLASLSLLQSGSGAKFDESRAKEIEAEAKMLRGHYYFFLYRIFKNIPYIDENTSTSDAAATKNDVDVMPMIISDLQFAAGNLPVNPPLGEIGRSTKAAAQAYLGKVYLYQKQFADALPLFKEVIASRPAITDLPFEDNFNVTTENGPESIFTAQSVINPDNSGDNANVGDMLAGLYGTAPVNCCGFNQPSIDLVNAYKVDANGLPLFENNAYRNNPYISDLGLQGAAKDNYKVDQSIAFDTRLDYTVGRRGVPYKDWGIMPGDAWIRDPAYGGPFVNEKDMINIADFAGNTVSGAPYLTSLNVNLIRLADVYLMAAECAVETGDLGYALTLVNDVRARAAKLPPEMIGNTPAAQYKIGLYPSFPSADYARNAVRFERRLELAEEGHRFFDLVRWGIAKETIESYSGFEGNYLINNKGITFDADKDTYYPIPQSQIDRSNGALTQNY
jgi:hypothetical protein